MPLHERAMARFNETVREAPIVIPATAALALFVIWATKDAGYPLTHWAPGGVILLVLLVIAVAAAPLRLSRIPIPVRVAVACLGLYTALSYLSILWAQVPGDAWEGANRTFVYLLVFAMFALWPQSGRSAASLLCLWLLAMIVLAVFVILHIDAAVHPAELFNDGRLKYPADYENACAAVWCMVLWPALLMSRSERLHWALRGVLAGGAVLVADLALLSQSRGSFYATVVMLVLVFALVPGRVRTLVALVPVALGIGLTVKTVLHVGDSAQGGDLHAAIHSAMVAIFVAAIVVGAIAALGAAIESRGVISEESRGRLKRAIAVAALAALVVAIVGGWVAAGNPIARAEHGWHTFKGGYNSDNAHVNRLVSGLGSNRYDFYRVALDEFAAHPVVGIGADNFSQQYLAKGHAEETPHYPHSVEMRTLAETGIVGALLGIIGLGAALLGAGGGMLANARRGRDPLAAAVAAAALAGFAYWLVHGSFDWFWEFAGLGAPAFALLGLACAVAPRRTLDASADTPGAVGGGPRPVARRLALGALAILALGGAGSLIAPWLSELQTQKATRIWPTAPRRAYAALDKAARLNPLSDEPYLLAGSIALRFNDLAKADHEFALALGRDSGDAYATLERAAIASERGERAQALALLERATQLNPRDELIRATLRRVREGQRVDIDELNRLILDKAQQLA
jgi:O-Antigen ligase